MIDAEWGNLPFEAAIAFFRDKLNVPTEKWFDLWAAEHAQAFTVAGSAQADILVDLRKAVDAAIADGEAIQDFRKRFDEVVAKTGWSYYGKRGWRTSLIYETNVRNAYSAGRWNQMQRIAHKRPYLQYRHGDTRQPRPHHVAWDGLILPADDPWWHTHWPPNGFGCKCRVESLSERDLKRKGLSVNEAPDDGTYTWTNPDTGEKIEHPMGIDPGWAYNVGMERYQPNMDKYPAQLRAFLQQ